MDEINICSAGKIISRIYVEDGVGKLEGFLAPYRHVFAVMDSNVAMQCPVAQEIAEIMNRKGAPGKLIEASEELKTIDTVMDICSWLLDSGADRDALVLAVGGGITSDMVGFAASIYKRGVRFAYVPTTLLAQVDAAIGGKTGVNLDYKNILGVIRQPEFTYICPQVLASLPHRDFMSGAAEMLKTFLIEDNGCYGKAVGLLSEMRRGYAGLPEDSAAEYWADSIGAYSGELTALIAAAVRVKAEVVSRDQFEKGERRKLNLGHTFAHAIESLSRRYPDAVPGGITHGEAVAVGMAMAAGLAGKLPLLEAEDGFAEHVEADFRSCGLSIDCPFAIADMAEAMKKDKKAEGGKIHFVLPRAVGDVVMYDMSVEEVCRLMSPRP